MPRPAKSDKEFKDHFWSMVDKSGECWIWLRGKDSRGYGRIWRSGKKRQAHRIAYEISIGIISDGLYVCHKCDNPPCVRPSHLFLGTHADNVRDCTAKGRNTLINSPELWRRGDDHWTRQKTKKTKRLLKEISDKRKAEWASGKRTAIRDARGRIMGSKVAS